MADVRLRFQKGDLLAIVGVLLLAALVFMLFLPKGNSPAAFAEIYQNGKLIKTVSLSVEQEFTISGECNNVIAVRGGRISVIRSDCPGEDCVGCGWVHTAGRSIVCLPNGLEIRVVAESDNVDIVVG